jgi:VanZ family protein
MSQHKNSQALRQVRIGLMVASIFLACMAGFFVLHDGYRDIGPEIAGRGDFERAQLTGEVPGSGGRWERRGESVRWEANGGFDSSGGVRLGTREGRGSSLVFTLDDPLRFQFLRLSGRLRTEGVVVGEAPWDTARLMLLFTDKYDIRHTEYEPEVCVLVGAQEWQLCEKVFAVPDYAVKAEMVVENEAATGTLWVDDVRLTPAAEKPSTFYWKALFAALWCGVLVYCVWLAQLPRRVLGVAAIGVALAIIVGVAVPESTVERTLNRGAYVASVVVNAPFASVLNPTAAQSPASAESRYPAPSAFKRPPPLRSDAVYTLKKLGHFLLFGVLACVTFYCAARPRPGAPAAAKQGADLPTLALALLVFAAGTEVLQFLTLTRGPSLVDWSIDAGGILVGAWIALLARRFADRSVQSNPVC